MKYLGGNSIARLAFSATMVVAFTLSLGCGAGSNQSVASQTGSQSGSTTGGPNGTSGTALVQVRVGDAPADRVVAFELTIGNPLILTSTSGARTSVAISSNRIEFTHMSSKFEPFTMVNLPSGSYSSADITILNPEMTFLNLNGTLTKIDGAPTQTVTVTFSTPVTVGTAAAVLNVDLNVSNSLSVDNSGNITGFNLTGSSFGFSAKAIAAEDRQQDDDGEVENVVGLVTSVSSSMLTVKVGQGGAVLNFATDASTKFSDGITSAASALNQIVRIEGVTKADGSLFAKEVEGSESSNGAELEGLVTHVTGNPAVSVDMIGHDGVGNGMDDTKVGATFSVDVSNVKDSKYRVATGKMDFANLQVPGPLFPFDRATVHAGQRVEVESAGAIPAANGTLSAERITLQQQTISGTVSNFAPGLNGAATFDLNLPADGSASLSVLSQRMVVHVFVQPQSDNRVEVISNGASVRVRGLLFWTGSSFNMIARRIGS